VGRENIRTKCSPVIVLPGTPAGAQGMEPRWVIQTPCRPDCGVEAPPIAGAGGGGFLISSRNLIYSAVSRTGEIRK
jgi:hypothetical protein